MTAQHKQAFWKGVRQGIPIALGYLSVSFSIGILAVKAGLSVSAAVAISMTNVTSAGQAAGIGVIAAGGAEVRPDVSTHDTSLPDRIRDYR